MQKKFYHTRSWRRIYFSFLLAALCSLTGYGQETQVRSVKGTITNESGEPLPGVTVVEKGTNNGTVSGSTGEFVINISISEQLIFSFIGYSTKEVDVSASNQVTVVMAENTKLLNEIVVVGYGTQKKANLTGSVSQVETSDLTSRPFSSATNALQGLAPGVTVTTNSGAPGDAGQIRIRGIGTLNNSNPLVLIDGVEGDLNMIDLNLVESINVLKDAASSAIYGSRAANGVILVTTKRAKSNELSISYNGYTGFQSPTNLPDKVGVIDHMEMINLAQTNSGASPLYSDEFIEEYKQNMGSDPDHYPNTDWQKEILKGSGFMQSHNLAVNAGTEKFKVLTSVNYLEQKGIIEASHYGRFTFRNNADIKFSDKFSAKIDVQYIKANTSKPGGGLNEVFLQMNRIPAVQPGQFSNGLYGEGWNGNNPIAFSTYAGGSQEEEVTSLLGRFSINYQPFSWLNVEVVTQPKYEELYNDNFNKAINTYQADGSPLFTRPEKTTLANRSIRSFYGNYYGYLTATRDIGQHGLKLLLGTSLETFDTRNFRASRDNFTFPQFRVLNAGSEENRDASGSASEWALQSFFSRFNYDFDSKYLFEFNARYDGSSRFAKGYKFGFFPSVSAGWRISSESFMQGVDKVIENLMLRASWGRLGNQNISTYPFASTLSLGSYTMGGEIVPIAALEEMSNESISWETTEMTNIGLDLLLFKNLTVNFDWYNKITSDILLQLEIPTSIGLEPPVQNAGKVSNRGWELGISYNKDAGEFTYGIGFNLSDVKNNVEDLKGISDTGLLVNQEGHPMNSIYALEADGYFQSQEEIDNHVTQIGTLAPGDIRYINQNPEVDDIINADDRVIIGNTIPRFTYGANINAGYKNFTFNVFIQGVGKVDGYLYGRAIQPFYSGASAYEQHKDYWTEDNRNAAFPRLTWGDSGNNYQHSDFWMKDASYLRVKNIQIGYDLPSAFLQKIKIQRARIYVNGQNLFTLDDFWEGFDVETPVGTGTDYPQVKIYSLGLDVTF